MLLPAIPGQSSAATVGLPTIKAARGGWDAFLVAGFASWTRAVGQTGFAVGTPAARGGNTNDPCRL